jgi:8-oxo-dGTP pyrophosphatase MutT (NUDIX family)
MQKDNPHRSLQHRRAARTILIDGRDRVLLFRGGDPARPEARTWWFTPGGEVNPGESLEDAARRELREETGVRVSELGPAIFAQSVQLEFEGVRYQQDEDYFLVRIDEPDIDETGWTDSERRAVVEYRWWSANELGPTAETVYPPDLVALLADHVPAFGTAARAMMAPALPPP